MGSTRRPRCGLVAALLVLCGAAIGYAQSVDLDSYYAFPWSLGFAFESISPYGGDQQAASTYNGFAASVRIPLTALPTLQPFARLGVNFFTAAAPAGAGGANFDNTQLFGLAGIGWSSRFSKNFELGADFGLGYEMIVFPSLNVLDPSGTPSAARTDNLLATVGAHIMLNPAYSFAIDVAPTLTYRLGLQSLTSFTGFTFGIGWML